MATVSVEIKMNEELQRAATDVFEKLGLDFSTAIKIFLKRSVLANGIPFNMTLPKRNYKAERAVRAFKGNLKHFPQRTFIITPREMLNIIELEE